MNSGWVSVEGEELAQRVSDLEIELSECQYNMEQLSIEKKEWTSRQEELWDSIRREHEAHFIEIEKRENDLENALALQKQLVLDLKKALREIQSKSKELDAQESEIRRDRLSLNSEREAHETSLTKRREDLVEWERKLTEGEERLAKGQSILLQRQEMANDKDRSLQQKEKDLSQKSSEIDRSLQQKEKVLSWKSSEIDRKLKELETRENAMEKNLEMRKKLHAMEEMFLIPREREEIQMESESESEVEFEKLKEEARKRTVPCRYCEGPNTKFGYFTNNDPTREVHRCKDCNRSWTIYNIQ